MDKEKELPKRKATRMYGADYNTVGAYFITICTKNRRCLLSRIVGDDVPYKTNSDGASFCINV